MDWETRQVEIWRSEMESKLLRPERRDEIDWERRQAEICRSEMESKLLRPERRDKKKKKAICPILSYWPCVLLQSGR